MADLLSSRRATTPTPNRRQRDSVRRRTGDWSPIKGTFRASTKDDAWDAPTTGRTWQNPKDAQGGVGRQPAKTEAASAAADLKARQDGTPWYISADQPNEELSAIAAQVLERKRTFMVFAGPKGLTVAGHRDDGVAVLGLELAEKDATEETLRSAAAERLATPEAPARCWTPHSPPLRPESQARAASTTPYEPRTTLSFDFGALRESCSAVLEHCVEELAQSDCWYFAVSNGRVSRTATIHARCGDNVIATDCDLKALRGNDAIETCISHITRVARGKFGHDPTSFGSVDLLANVQYYHPAAATSC